MIIADASIVSPELPIVLLIPRVIENRHQDGRVIIRELQSKMTGVFEKERLPNSEDLEKMIEGSDVLDQGKDQAYESYMQ